MGEGRQEFLLFAVFVVKRTSSRCQFRAVVFRSVLEPSPRVGELCGMGSVVEGHSSSEFADISTLVDDIGRCVRRRYIEFGEREFHLF
jgi:hypothetical protein